MRSQDNPSWVENFPSECPSNSLTARPGSANSGKTLCFWSWSSVLHGGSGSGLKTSGYQLAPAGLFQLLCPCAVIRPVNWHFEFSWLDWALETACPRAGHGRHSPSLASTRCSPHRYPLCWSLGAAGRSFFRVGWGALFMLGKRPQARMWLVANELPGSFLPGDCFLWSVASGYPRMHHSACSEDGKTSLLVWQLVYTLFSHASLSISTIGQPSPPVLHICPSKGTSPLKPAFWD